MEKVYSKNLRVNNINKILLFILFVLFSLTVGLFLSKQETTSFFLLDNLANIKTSLIRSNGVRIEPYELAPGYEMILFLFHKICGVSLINVLFLPVGILVTPIAYFVLIRKIFKNDVIAFASAFYIIFDIAQTDWYNTFAYAFSRPLYLLCILLCIYIFQKGKRIVFMIPLLLMFVGAVFIHYTVPVWVITFLVIFYIFSKVETNHKKANWLITILLFTAIYLTFNQTFYKVFVPSYANMVYGTGHHDPLLDIWLQFESFITGKEIIPGKYEYLPSRGIFDATRLLLNFAILIPIILSLPKLIKKLWTLINNMGKRSKSNSDIKFYIYCSFLISVPMQALIYGAVFHISNQFILFLGLPIAMMALGLFQAKKKVMVLFLVLIFAVAAINFSLSFSYKIKEPTYSFVKPGADWVFNTTDQEQKPIILTGIEELFYYKFIGVDYNSGIRFSYYFTPHTYDRIVFHNYSNLNKSISYVVIDKLSYTYLVRGEFMRFYEPISHYDEEINANPNLNKVYNNGNVWIYKT